MTPWIEQLVEPERLILSWRPPEGVVDRKHWAVGELYQTHSGVEFSYYSDEALALRNDGRTVDALCAAGFRGYPAFTWPATTIGPFRKQALEAFARRLPSPQRADFSAYLERFRLQPGPDLSTFALLGATGAPLPNDGFSLIDPLRADVVAQDVILEVNGFRYYAESGGRLEVGHTASLKAEPENPYDRNAVRIDVDGAKIGYVSRLQAPAVLSWLRRGGVSAWVARINGSADRPRAFIFLRMTADEMRPAA